MCNRITDQITDNRPAPETDEEYLLSQGWTRSVQVGAWHDPLLYPEQSTSEILAAERARRREREARERVTKDADKNSAGHRSRD